MRSGLASLAVLLAMGCSPPPAPIEPPPAASPPVPQPIASASAEEPAPLKPPAFCHAVSPAPTTGFFRGFGPRTGLPGVAADATGIECDLPDPPKRADFDSMRGAPDATVVDLHPLMKSGRKCDIVTDFSAMSALTSLRIIRSIPAECVSRMLSTATLDHLESLDVYCGDETSIDMHAVAKLQGLKDLTLGLGCARGPDGLAPLGALPSLEKLLDEPDTIAGIGALTHLKTLTLTTPDLHDLGSLAALEVLYLDTSASDYASLRSLVNLRELTIRSGVSGFDPKVLVDMHKLEFLDLAVSGVKDLASLAKLTSLRSLEVDVALVKTIAPLASLQSLERLELRGGCAKTSFDLAPLKKLKHLEEVSLPAGLDSKSGAQVKALQAANPKLEITTEMGPRHCGGRR